jgi:uncharacterized protein (UPF0335 family)
MALAAVGRLWQVARKIEELFTLHAKVEGSLLVIDQRLKAMEDRMIRLESEQTQIITEARSAATAASTAVAGAVISDVVTRITRLEGRADQLEQDRRLPPPP